MLKKLIRLRSEIKKLPFWEWIARRDKIRKLKRELEAFQMITLQSGREISLYRIAKAQQELLNKKN